MIVNPKAASQKYSGGPKLRDARARGGEKKIKKATPTKPPKTEAMVAVMDALPTRDLFVFAEALGPKLPPVELPMLSKIGAAAPQGGGGG